MKCGPSRREIQSATPQTILSNTSPELGVSRQPPLALQDNILFYGDNLDILRRRIPDECIDLIYLDPPFNSKAYYNLLFKEKTDEESTAQMRAFTDFWHWDAAARETYEYLSGNQVNDRVATVADSLFRLLGRNDMNAYLFMMTIRLVELHRVLKETGSLFLHCDPNASHYLKLVLDGIFGPENFTNEIIWKRRTAHSDKAQGARHLGRIHDTILCYSKSEDSFWHAEYTPYSEEYARDGFPFKEEGTGRYYQLNAITGPGGASKGNPYYEFLGVKRYWRFKRETMERLYKEGKIVQTKPGNVPRQKRYLDEMPGVELQDIWLDIKPVSNSKEDLGYQTQKPSALVERIINVACPRDGWVLDPFCGCGTTISAAETLRRHWIGIDVTYLAINVIKRRLAESFPRSRFRIEGEPRDLEAARALARDRYQFQWWALDRIEARPIGSKGNSREGKKGADHGIDGWLRFKDGNGNVERIVVQVKSGHVGVKDIRELRDVLARQRAAIGIFLTLEDPTSEMLKEAKATEPYSVSVWQKEYPKVQIITIDSLLKGAKPDIPPTINPFQEAPLQKASSETKQRRLF